MRLTTLEGQYQCIVIDPPWFYRLRNQDKTHRNRINYKPM
ncbi:adenine-specific DNA methyltransferase, partial [Nostoc sp. 'Peltigera membranacea cyanobiont' 213]